MWCSGRCNGRYSYSFAPGMVVIAMYNRYTVAGKYMSLCQGAVEMQHMISYVHFVTHFLYILCYVHIRNLIMAVQQAPPDVPLSKIRPKKSQLIFPSVSFFLVGWNHGLGIEVLLLQLRLFCRICSVERGECASDVSVLFPSFFVASSYLLLPMW